MMLISKIFRLAFRFWPAEIRRNRAVRKMTKSWLDDVSRGIF
jgi:hypothetical protein